MGSSIATQPNKEYEEMTESEKTKFDRTRFDGKKVFELEEWTDTFDSQILPLRNFILPGGGFAGAYLHNSRVISRRLERVIWDFIQNKETEDNVIEESIPIYLNRLSDFLFVSARYACRREFKEEIPYKKQ